MKNVLLLTLSIVALCLGLGLGLAHASSISIDAPIFACGKIALDYPISFKIVLNNNDLNRTNMVLP